MGQTANNGKPVNRAPSKSKTAGVKYTPEQYKLIQARAERCKMSVSAWFRSVSLQAAASRVWSNGKIYIREPVDGVTI